MVESIFIVILSVRRKEEREERAPLYLKDTTIVDCEYSEIQKA